MKLKPIIKDVTASAVPLILYVVTILFCGALYTLFFLEIFYPLFLDMVPASDSKVFITMVFYAIPLIVLLVGVIAVIRSGLKKYYIPVDQSTYNQYYGGG